MAGGVAIEHAIVAVALTSGGMARHCTPESQSAQIREETPDVLAEFVLDDLRFQELVSEARTRIARHSPDWTEHNVSDPGITLLELFAWFTDILVYRINRIPDRLHLALLDLVGVKPAPPRIARAGVRFMLDPSARETTVPTGTQVASPRTAGQDAIVFQTTEALTLPAGELAVHAPELQPSGHTLLLGFERPLSGLAIRLEIEGVPADATAASPPPVWEASGPAGTWHAASVVCDETDGLLLGSGAVIVDVPAQSASAVIGGHELHWLRCRAAGRPAVALRRAQAVGGTVAAVHAAAIVAESLGVSEGVPGVVYPLSHRPVLEMEARDTLEVSEPGTDRWVQWRPVASFADSGAGDRHFMLDLERGELRFGPAIRQPDGGWRQFGAVPPAGSALRFTRYRFGGGRAGNVAAGALAMLASPVAGVVSVTNPEPAVGGADAEPLESARQRAALELRTRSRAVTVEDFERLTVEASPLVARALCSAPPGNGPVRVHVLPRVDPPDRLLTLS